MKYIKGKKERDIKYQLTFFKSFYYRLKALSVFGKKNVKIKNCMVTFWRLTVGVVFEKVPVTAV